MISFFTRRGSPAETRKISTRLPHALSLRNTRGRHRECPCTNPAVRAARIAPHGWIVPLAGTVSSPAAFGPCFHTHRSRRIPVSCVFGISAGNHLRWQASLNDSLGVKEFVIFRSSRETAHTCCWCVPFRETSSIIMRTLTISVTADLFLQDRSVQDGRN